MKKYTMIKTDTVDKLFCNCCGKEIPVDKGIAQKGVFSVRHAWGYFSGKDGQIHSFDLCEDCYDEITGGFAIPVTVEDATELV